MSSFGLKNQKSGFARTFPIYMINFILLLLSSQTVSFVSVDAVHVVLFLIPLFYWVIHQPAVLPLWFVFLGGLSIDFALDGVLGLHAFGFILMYQILYRMRRIILSQPWLYHFIIFAFSAFLFELMRWGMASLLLWQGLPYFPSVLSFALNLVAFPPVILVLRMLHRVMSGYGRSF